MKAQNYILFLLVACLMIGCNSTKVPTIVQAKGPAQHRYLFDVYHVNHAWGYTLSGVSVDNQGHVVTYHHDFAEWIPEEPGSLLRTELDEKYSAVGDTIAIIDQATISQMSSLIAEAQAGELSATDLTACDAGLYYLICYRYDVDSGRYHEVLLSMSGDYRQTNLSDAAGELSEWLRSVAPNRYQWISY